MRLRRVASVVARRSVSQCVGVVHRPRDSRRPTSSSRFAGTGRTESLSPRPTWAATFRLGSRRHSSPLPHTRGPGSSGHRHDSSARSRTLAASQRLHRLGTVAPHLPQLLNDSHKPSRVLVRRRPSHPGAHRERPGRSTTQPHGRPRAGRSPCTRWMTITLCGRQPEQGGPTGNRTQNPRIKSPLRTSDPQADIPDGNHEHATGASAVGLGIPQMRSGGKEPGKEPQVGSRKTASLTPKTCKFEG